MGTSVPGEVRRVGIIGYGLAGSVFHAPLVASTPGLTVAAIVTGNPERRELLFDLGAHLVDQVPLLFGPPQSVYAETAARRPDAAVDDDIFVALRFAGGAIAHLWMSMIPRRIGPRFRVVGMRGVYEKRGLDPQEEGLRAGRDRVSPAGARSRARPGAG